MERAVYRGLLLFAVTFLAIWAFGLILKPFIVAIVYSLLGAFIFIHLERGDDIERKVAAARERLIARRNFMLKCVFALLP